MINDEERLNIARQLHASGRIREAQKIYLELSVIHKNNNKLLYLIGTTFLQLKNYDEAINNYNKSLNLGLNIPDLYNNLGIALAEKKEYSEALKNYNKAITFKNDYIDAYINRGISLYKLKKFEEAIKDFNFVINLQPNNPKVHNNLGNVFKEVKKYDEAINSYNEAIKNNKNFLEAISNKAEIYDIQKKYKESLTELNKIYKINPEFKDLIQKIISNKMSIFDWKDFYKFKKLIKSKLSSNEIVLDPLFIFYLFDDPKIQMNNSKNFMKREFLEYKKIDFIKNKKKNNKIRIGYFSGDFYNHPVLHIMSEIFKHHNKSIFELYAFSHGPQRKNNIWKDSVLNYFHKFHEVYKMKDEEILQIAKKDNIDIAIDLSGMTKYGRSSIFYNRVAPRQINYLGYPGSSGIENMDYILADKLIVREEEEKFYTEKVCYFPKCYIPSSNDIQLKTSNKQYSRSQFNLPKNNIVFCAFHNPHKINPDIFNVWSNILNQVDDSVLWVKINDENAKENLKKEANKNKLDADRIVFAKGIENISDHIERLKLADIFLDTYPYNSHSTVYDYLKANLPMIIMEGKSFSSRVGSTIYSSLGLSELVAKNLEDYEKIAVHLAQNKLKIKELKNKIQFEIKNNYLFNGKKFTKDLENIYLSIFKEKN